VEGPQGVIVEGMRKVSLKQSGSGPKDGLQPRKRLFCAMIEENQREEDEREETEENARKVDGIKEDVGAKTHTEEDAMGEKRTRLKRIA